LEGADFDVTESSRFSGEVKGIVRVTNLAVYNLNGGVVLYEL